MTEKTDIKALRERLVGLNRTYALISSPATMEQANTSAHMFVKAGGINRIIEALDRLEAERQRTAGSEEELHKALHREKATERKLLAALEELTALKGDQVPVSAEFFADGKWWPFSNAEHKANTIAAGYPVRELFTAAPKPVVVLPQLNDDLVEILGRPNFTCAGLAELFRRNGADIKRKSENEQAFVIHWLMGVYLKHDSEWRVTAEAELKAIAAKVKAENAAGVVKDGE